MPPSKIRRVPINHPPGEATLKPWPIAATDRVPLDAVLSYAASANPVRVEHLSSSGGGGAGVDSGVMDGRDGSRCYARRSSLHQRWHRCRVRDRRHGLRRWRAARQYMAYIALSPNTGIDGVLKIKRGRRGGASLDE